MTASLPEDTPYGEMIAHYALGMCEDWAGHPVYSGAEHAGLNKFLSECADGLRWQRDEIERLRREVAECEKAAYKRGWNDRESDFLAGMERTGLAVVSPDALADAHRAGAEAMREACAAEVDCRCAARDAVLAAMERGGTPRPDWLCPIGGNCHATLAQDLRELPLPPMKPNIHHNKDDARTTAAMRAAARAWCICEGECYATRHGDLHGPCEAREEETELIITAFLRALQVAGGGGAA